MQRTCSKCGISKPETLEFFRRRGTSDRGGLRPDCRSCSDERDRAYQLRNRDRIREQRAEYRARSVTLIKAAELAYARSDSGRAARGRASAKWSTSPAGKLSNREAAHRRRVSIRGGIADLTEQDWVRSLAAFGGCCAYCGTGGAMTVDHVVPVFSGGHHTASNIVPACKSCNSSKFHHELVSWFTAQPFFVPARLARIRDYVRGAHAQAAGADQRR